MEKALQEAVGPKGTSYINLDKFIWNSTLLTIIRSICLKCNWWAIRIGKNTRLQETKNIVSFHWSCDIRN
jgi:hypothetical protein